MNDQYTQDGQTALQEPAPVQPGAPAPAAAPTEQAHVAGTEAPSEYTQSERFVAAIGYISFLCLLPLVLRRDSAYCQFHGKQALLLCIIFFALRWVVLIPILFINILWTLFELFVILFLAYLTWTGHGPRIPLLAEWAEGLALTAEEEAAMAEAERQKEEQKALDPNLKS